MADRDRLIELFNKVEKNPEITCPKIKCKTCKYNIGEYLCDVIARKVDYLLANGVIVPPCNVGDTVYSIMETSCEDIDGVNTVCEFYNIKFEDLCTYTKGKCPYQYRVAKCIVTKSNLLHFTEWWGKTAFPTKEEAEQALQK